MISQSILRWSHQKRLLTHGCALTQDSTWDEIDALAEGLSDSRRVQDRKGKAKKSLESHGHSFDILCEFKNFCNNRDPYLLYRFNDERQNGDNTFVFMCSIFQANLVIYMSMDCAKNGLLHDQYWYADANHKRFPGFKAITLWVYHPLLRKLISLLPWRVQVKVLKLRYNFGPY